MKQLDLNEYTELLAPRPRDAHKNLFGHVLVVGGDYGMPGAVRMAAEAALRVGAGLVSVATRLEHIAAINGVRPEIMCHGLTKPGEELPRLMQRATVMVLGPGLGQSTWSQQVFSHCLANSLPKVVDADGLNLLAKQPLKQENWILTPHVGEAARLLACTTSTIQADRLAAITALQKRHGGVIVLKGQGSLVLGSKNPVTLCPYGNPGMASAGMGDVLSGIIGGLLAQGLDILQAAELGVCLHGHAGDLAAQKEGERGLLALDLIPYLRKLVNP